MPEQENIETPKIESSNKEADRQSFWSAVKSLLKSTLSKRDSTTRDKYFLYVLYSRTGFFYFILTFLRIINLSFWKEGRFKGTIICSATVNKDCIERYNEELVDKLESYFQNILTAMLFLNLVICMLTYKWRQIANYIWLFELATDIVSSFLPNFYNYDRLQVL